MIKSRRQARDRLADSTTSNFWDIVDEIRISPEEREILDERFIKFKSITKIAKKHNCSEERINKLIAKTYDKIFKLMMR